METPPPKENRSPQGAPPSKRDLRALEHDHRDFIRVLILDPWFRVALVLAVLGFCAAVISLPKFWRVTPLGFKPQVRVSLLNLAQAWRLRESARSKEAGGLQEEAVEAWNQAFRKNLGDVATAREVLRSTLALSDLTPRAVQRAAGIPAWLLSLSNTNAQDVLLVARFLDKSGNSEDVFNLLEPLKDRLSVQEEVAYLKTLVERGADQEYATRWKRAESELAKDPEFALYHAAYLAVWGPVEGKPEARQQLARAAEDPNYRVLASRLQLLHLTQAGDLPGFEQAFARLVEARADRLRDHIAYWSLLVAAGRTDEVRSLVEQKAATPQGPREALALADVYQALGMVGEAGRLLRQATLKYSGSGAAWTQALWLSRANLLVRAKDWSGILEMVEHLRGAPAALQLLGGWVDAIEGQAHHGLDHRELAAAAFTLAAQKAYPTPLLAFEVGLELKRLGYHKPALSLLLPLEQSFQTNSVYWETLYYLADAMKQDPVLLLKAATQARKLKPRDAGAKFNYAAALLVNRQDAGEAVALTREALERAGGAAEAKVNHCLALVLNQRYEEAAALLATVDPNRFDEFGRSIYYYCSFGIHLGLERKELARVDLERIQPHHLFPNERVWLEQMRRERLEPAAQQ